MKKFWPLLLIALLTIPTFTRMLRPGIYSMQDFHYFRLNQFHKCVVDLQIPCRWSPDSGLGYGEPLFNFYGQTSYAVGEVFYFLGLAHVDALKATFIFSLIASAVAMYLLALLMWKNSYAAFLSASLYTYAPYRAVDVWVRGALPEAMSFVLFPLIFLFLERFLQKKNRRDLLLFAGTFALLIVTHNLSALIFAPLIATWTLYRLKTTNSLQLFKPLLLSAPIVFLLTSFYILPVLVEGKYINLDATTLGYFNFRGHFTTTYQLLFSRLWGYGGSTFGPEDGLSLSIGYLQWVLPLVAIVLLLITKKFKKFQSAVVLFLAGFACLFLTHERSTMLWVAGQDIMKFIQFPWRFLGVGLFFLSLCSGVIPLFTKKFISVVTILLVVAAVLLNFSFFKEDIWYGYSDEDLTQGVLWEQQSRASIGDFWPKSAGIIPTLFAPHASDDYELIEKRSNKSIFKIRSTSSDINFPQNDFPGWKKEIVDNKAIFTFTNTPIRNLGNILTLTGIGVLGFLFLKNKKYEA